MASAHGNGTAPDAVRVDAWLWAVRLFATRSSAAEACRGGHVRVNGSHAKPAQSLRVGDTVRALTPGGERIVVVRGLIAKRVGAAVAVTQFEDRTPPAPPREERGLAGFRERGLGRPTKRDRRDIDRLRGR